MDGDVVAFVLGALPEPPARVLEVGAGRGELAAELGAHGYDVLAIDPAGHVPEVTRAALIDLDEPPGSFDAAVAVLSLHHVDPLEPSCEKLAGLVRPGGRLVVDEFDVERLDERAARWWTGSREAATGESQEEPAALVRHMRAHLHPVAGVLEALAPGFRLEDVSRGAYLYRWDLPPGLRGTEEQLIADGRIPATGVRFTGAKLTNQHSDIYTARR